MIIIKNAIRYFLALISTISFFRRHIVFYGAEMGLTGNLLLAYKDLIKTRSCIYLKNDKMEKSIGIYLYSPKGLLYALFSRNFIISVRMPGFVNISAKTVIQLWHGIPVKNIGVNSHEYSESLKSKMCAEFSKYQYIFCSEGKYREILCQSFGLNVQRSFVNCLTPLQYELLRFSQHESKMRAVKTILYAPTFRASADRDWDLHRHITGSFLSYLQHNSITLYFKYHPNDTAVRKELSSDTVILGSKTDIYDVLKECDVLITDYSSLIFDASLLRKDIYLFCSDLSDYVLSRGVADMKLFANYSISDVSRLMCAIQNQEGTECSLKIRYEYFNEVPKANPYQLISDILCIR